MSHFAYFSVADWIVFVLFLLSGVAVNIYVPIYMTRPWWTTPAGRAMMVKGWGNLILLDLGLTALLFGPDYPGRDVVRVIGMAVFTAGMWYLLLTMLRAPRTRRSSTTDRPGTSRPSATPDDTRRTPTE